MQEYQKENISSIPASQQRVTPEELAHAIAVLEERKLREEEEAANTLTIGEAVSQICPDMTEEELWAEVQRQREEQSAPPAFGTSPEEATQYEQEDGPEYHLFQPSLYPNYQSPYENTSVSSQEWRNFAAKFAGICGALVVFYWMLCGLEQVNTPVPVPQVYVPYNQHNSPMVVQPQQYVTVANMVHVPDAAFFAKLAQCVGPHPTYRIMAVDQGIMPGQFAPVSEPIDTTLYPERAIPDGYSIYRNHVATYMWSETGKVFFRPTKEATYALLDTTRYAGRLYIRLWTSQGQKARVLSHATYRVYGDQSPAHKVSMTIPIQIANNSEDKAFSKQLTQWNMDRSLNSTDEIPLAISPNEGIVLDSHAWNAFTPTMTAAQVKSAWQGRLENLTVGLPTVGMGMVSLAGGNLDFDVSSNLQSVQNIPNQREFRVSMYTLQAICAPEYGTSGGIRHINPAVQVDIRPDWWRPYTLIKHKGNIYLQGWVQSTVTASQVESETARIFVHRNSPLLGSAPRPIQVPLDGCVFSPDSQTNQDGSLLLQDVTLDAYAWKSWQAQTPSTSATARQTLKT